MSGSTLKIPTRVRCLARPVGENQWVACSLEFGLAAQADTFDESRQKLEAQINDFVKIALAEEPKFAARLLRRRAPAWAYGVWYAIRAVSALRRSPLKADGRVFLEQTPRLAVA